MPLWIPPSADLSSPLALAQADCRHQIHERRAIRVGHVRPDGCGIVSRVGFVRGVESPSQFLRAVGRLGDRSVVRVVDAAGSRNVLQTAAPVNVFAFTSRGILLIDMSLPAGGGEPDGSLNLKLLDPATGAVRPFPFPGPQQGMVREAGGGTEAGVRREDDAIWMTAYSPAADSTVVIAATMLARAAQTLCRSCGSAVNGQPDGERGTPGNAADLHRPAVRSDHGVDDGQSEPGAAVGAGSGGIAAGESLEHVRQQVRRHARPVVHDR